MASSSSSALILNNSRPPLMASSSSPPRNWRYNVFTSFHGADVRKTFLSHLRKQFDRNGITMFDDQGIERGETIAPALTEAIRESRISIVVLSKNYASSSWCLDELVEILECKRAIGQIVMTVFYGPVDPSDVRKQTGDFGRVFDETCGRKTEEDKKRWSQALEAVGNIAGEHFLNWGNEAEMIEKIAKDVSHKLNATPSSDFDGMVGLEAHLREMQSLLDLDYNGVKFVGVYGPAGIGKTTIARALQSLISYRFQLTCFVENLKEIFHSGLDEYGLKLRLQEILLSSILNQDRTRIRNLGAIRERLRDLKVLIILDDVNDVKQLEALANETTWFGPGSRIIVITENKKLFQRHGINNTYHVGFPSRIEALKILCSYAFGQSYPQYGFEELAEKVIEVCGNLPLGLRVVGSCLQGENGDKWRNMICRLETTIHRDIEEVLRVGYENLDDNEQTLFLHIAVFFNHKDVGLVKSMLGDDNNLGIEFSLESLVNKSLIYISTNRELVMHKLLQKVGMQAMRRQEPWKRQILFDAQDICDVLENDTGSVAVSGISFDTSGINEVIVSNKALRKMRNFRILRVYKTRHDGNDRVHIPKEMEFPPCLRLLHWKAYPGKSLPLGLGLQNLVELHMRHSKLERLWEGIQPLTNLKKMDLACSYHLKELPDLSNATNLEILNLGFCTSLVELPSTIGNLHKLEKLEMTYCSSLEVIPTHINLASLEYINMEACSRLRTFPNFSTNIKKLHLNKTALVELPSSIGNLHKLEEIDMGGCSSLEVIPTHINLASLVKLNMKGCSRLRTLPDFSTNIKTLCLSRTALEQVSASLIISNTGNIKTLPHLDLHRCRKLTSLPELPDSLEWLDAGKCESLERVTSPLNTPKAKLNFHNCFKLSGEARRLIIQGSYEWAFLPGRVMPNEFNHRARGNSLTIPLSSPSSSKFKACVMISSDRYKGLIERSYSYTVGSYSEDKHCLNSTRTRTEHLFIFHGNMPKASSEANFEFQMKWKDMYRDVSGSYDIIECGVRIIMDEPERTSKEYDDDSSYDFELNEVLKDSEERVISSYDSEEDDSSYVELNVELEDSEETVISSYDSEEDDSSYVELNEELEDSEDRVSSSCDSEAENVEGQEKHITDCYQNPLIVFQPTVSSSKSASESKKEVKQSSSNTNTKRKCSLGKAMDEEANQTGRVEEASTMPQKKKAKTGKEKLANAQSQIDIPPKWLSL